MPKQNRVAPSGELLAVPARGLFMGNRGKLHDYAGRIQRNWANKSWITCLLEFKNRHRTVMSPSSYTELFFLDEATALSAGHRPCAECRRKDFSEFKTLWLLSNSNHLADSTIRSIDPVLHDDRVGKDRCKRVFSETLEHLPDGTFITHPRTPDRYYLWFKKRLCNWTPNGYGRSTRTDLNTIVQVLTPRSIVRTLRAGYEPALHPSLFNILV